MPSRRTLLAGVGGLAAGALGATGYDALTDRRASAGTPYLKAVTATATTRRAPTSRRATTT